MKNPWATLAAIMLILLSAASAYYMVHLFMSASEQMRLGVITATIALFSTLYAQRRSQEREISARQFTKKAEVYEEMFNLISDMMPIEGLREGLDPQAALARMVGIRAKLLVWGS